MGAISAFYTFTLDGRKKVLGLIVLKVQKVKILKIDYELFRVIGLKYDKKSPPDFNFFSSSFSFALYSTPHGIMNKINLGK